jgi:ATP-dependent exoDNAse (exonuclease V) beta subunit
MTNKLSAILNERQRQQIAMDSGTNMHARLGKVFCDASGIWYGDADLVSRLSVVPELTELMGPLSKTEVPIAGKINGRFISRRVDRLYVNRDTKTVVVLDYKTDTNKKTYYQKYAEQLNEYRELLKQIFRYFDIRCKILWTDDFTLENLN